jgi:hypothetical protein
MSDMDRRAGDAGGFLLMGAQSGLTVRRFERHALKLEALVEMDQASSALVRFSPESGVSGTIRGEVRDLGEGGMSVSLPVFVPRRTVMRVRILEAGQTLDAPALDAKVRVMRVKMQGLPPEYVAGCAFVEASASIAETVRGILARHAKDDEAEARGAAA